MYADTHLRARFGIAIASALPLAALIAGRSLRRWMAIVASILVPSGIALAVVLPSGLCPGQVGGIFCDAGPDHPWGRFAIALGAIGAGTIFVAASGLRRSRTVTAVLMAVVGLAGAFFLPSSDGTPLLSPFKASLTDDRMPWRIGIALAAAFLGGLVWLHDRHQSAHRLPAISIL